MRSLDDLLAEGVAGRRVLVRADLNVPLDQDHRITDDGRIRASLSTLRALLDAGARVVVCAHLGRPKGRPVEDLSLRPVAVRLSELLGQPVTMAARPTDDVAGERAGAAVARLGDGDAVLLENVRFDPAETSKDDAERGGFADRLAALADRFVDDAFGVLHRRHASVYDVAQRLPHAAGRLVEAEVEVLRRLTDAPKRPYAVVLGGSKVSDKLAVIEALLGTADRLLIGGGMVYTFLAAKGHRVGTSLLEPAQLGTVRDYLAIADRRGVDIVLPVDIVAADAADADAAYDTYPADAIPDDRMGLDIGPESQQRFAAALADAATVFWNGPMGMFELAPFAAGTRAVAKALVEGPAFSVVGGGDSAAAVRALGFRDADFGHISTGGGASLEFLEGKPLPGLQVLED